MSERETSLHVVDRWGRLGILLFFVPCVVLVSTLGALSPTAKVPPFSYFASGLFWLAVIAWFYPTGRHAYITAAGITTLRMGMTIHGRTHHPAGTIARLELVRGTFFDTVILHANHSEPVLLTRILRWVRPHRAQNLIAKISSILGRD